MALETKQVLKPNTNVVLELIGTACQLLAPARVLRSEIVGLNGLPLYRIACAFKNPLDLSRFRSDGAGLRQAPRARNSRSTPSRLHLACFSSLDRRDLVFRRVSLRDDAPRHSQAETTATVENGSTSAAPIDMSGTRRAPRFKMVEGTEAEVDGKRVALVNLSVVGAQVCSASVLTPKQRVTVVFAYQQQSLQIPSVIASVSAETADGHVRYRAGIEFLDVNQSAVQRIIDGKRK